MLFRSFTVKDGRNTSSKKEQRTGIRQGCPLSPYLFILLLTVIMHDVYDDLTEEDRQVVREGTPYKVNLRELFYADDTLIMTKTAAAAEIILHQIEHESSKYNLKLNYTKCIHLRMNSLDTIGYVNGQLMPTHADAIYLGGKITANANYKKDISHRIAITWTTLKRLNLLWRKAPVSLKWKLRVFDAVITAKLIYGLETHLRSRNTPAHPPGLQKDRCLPIQRAEKAAEDQTPLLGKGKRRGTSD